jgi:hypothetical protein
MDCGGIQHRGIRYVPEVPIPLHLSSATNNYAADIQAVFQELRKVLGEIPILASEQVCVIDSNLVSCSIDMLLA